MGDLQTAQHEHRLAVIQYKTDNHKLATDLQQSEDKAKQLKQQLNDVKQNLATAHEQVGQTQVAHKLLQRDF